MYNGERCLKNGKEVDSMFSRYKDVLTHLPEYSKNIFRKGYFKWLIDQCRGWGWFSYGLLIFNFILQVWSMVQSFSAHPVTSVIAFIGGNLSVACVIGISNRSGIQGWAGLTSAICIATTAFIAHNYANAWEQIGYILFLDIFCILDPQGNDDIKAEKFDSWFDWIKYGIFFLIAWAVLHYIFSLTMLSYESYFSSANIVVSIITCFICANFTLDIRLNLLGSLKTNFFMQCFSASFFTAASFTSGVVMPTLS